MEHHLRCPNSFCPAISARIRVTAQSPKKIKNKTFAISAASEAMPPYPSAAAIREMTRKTTDHLSICLSFLQAAPQRPPAVGLHLEFRFVPIVPLHAFELVEEHMRHMMLFQGLIHDLFIVDLVAYCGVDD